jgi:hypothetical protein
MLTPRGMNRTTLVLAAVVATLAIVGCRRRSRDDHVESQERADQRYVLERLELVCDGRTYPQAAAYDRASAGPHRTAIFWKMKDRASGRETWRALSREANPLHPATFETTELVACLTAERDGRGDYASEPLPAKLRIFQIRTGDVVVEKVMEIPRGGGVHGPDGVIVREVRAQLEGG